MQQVIIGQVWVVMVIFILDRVSLSLIMIP